MANPLISSRIWKPKWLVLICNNAWSLSSFLILVSLLKLSFSLLNAESKHYYRLNSLNELSQLWGYLEKCPWIITNLIWKPFNLYLVFILELELLSILDFECKYSCIYTKLLNCTECFLGNIWDDKYLSGYSISWK